MIGFTQRIVCRDPTSIDLFVLVYESFYENMLRDSVNTEMFEEGSGVTNLKMLLLSKCSK